jgi:hypothetical protein
MNNRILHIVVTAILFLLMHKASYAQQNDECDSIPNFKTSFRALYDSISKSYEADNGFCLVPVIDSITNRYLNDMDRMQYLKLLNKIGTYSDGALSESVQDGVYKMLDKNNQQFLHDLFLLSKSDSVDNMINFIAWAATCPDPKDCALRRTLSNNLKNDIKAGKLFADELAFRQRVVDAVMK